MVGDVRISDQDRPGRDELVELYGSVSWGAYTHDPDRLVRALEGSMRVVTARRDGQLVGLARVVGDGVSIAYLQDILVHPDLHRSGLGRALISAVFEPLSDVRQKVLMTDAEPGQRAFYEAVGFTEVHDVEDGGLRAFVRFDPPA
ncbi:MAG TPA: GNAT family N-acetyltransferase [Candidatus Avipropionibacterium avicola]|uniref:GNAT family N-acetyltransferase n=1 Tax=Candidatus Avipropionibacterium avicola TaxID=2840701 RepID=A0A9D1GYG6_9ACTN|nr:GNAT family N-acetyltransferase [Candidatus Avipropionibacterium avicola]